MHTARVNLGSGLRSWRDRLRRTSAVDPTRPMWRAIHGLDPTGARFRARTNSDLRLPGQDRRTVVDRLPPLVGVNVVVLAALRLLHVETLRRWEGLARTEEMPVMRGSGQAFRAGQGEGTERGFQPVNGGALDQSTWGAAFGGGQTLEAGEVRVRRSQAELRGERRLLASIQLPSGSTTCGTPATTWRPPPGRAPRNRWRGWATRQCAPR
jgi:hypothetical protein